MDRKYLTNGCHRASKPPIIGTIIRLHEIPGRNRKAYEDDSLLVCDGV